MNRKITRTLLAAGVGAASYLAGSELGKYRPRTSGLLALACLGMSAAVSARAMNAHQRIDTLVPMVATANNSANSAQTAANAAQSTANAAQTTANNAMPKSGGTFTGAITVPSMTCNGTFNMTTGTISNLGAITGSPSIDGISMGGSLIMNNHDAFTFGHITANQIGPGGTRANLGSTPFTSAGLQSVADRCDWISGTLLQGANISY